MTNMFGDEDFGGGSVAARGVALVLIGIGAMISALATAAFFHEFAADLFSFISVGLSPWLAAAAGVFLFEFSAFAWAQVEAKHADTSEQIMIAAVGKWLALVGSVLTTVVFFSLRSSLVSDRLDDAAVFVMSMVGGLLIVVGSAGLFLLIAMYASSSADHVKARNDAAIRAMRSMAEHTINRETTAATLSKTIGEIRRELPNSSYRQGQKNAIQFAAENFDDDKWKKRLVDLSKNEGANNGRPTEQR